MIERKARYEEEEEAAKGRGGKKSPAKKSASKGKKKTSRNWKRGNRGSLLLVLRQIRRARRHQRGRVRALRERRFEGPQLDRGVAELPVHDQPHRLGLLRGPIGCARDVGRRRLDLAPAGAAR